MIMNRGDALRSLKNLSRDSANGYEVSVCMHGHNGPDWSWVAIRYPLGTDRLTEPSEVVQDFNGMTWPGILKWAESYLKDHPDDGFFFI